MKNRKEMDKIFHQKVIEANRVFETPFLDIKNLYLHYFNAIPNLSVIGCLNGELAFQVFKEKFGGLITEVFQYRRYHRKIKQYPFDRTVVILKNGSLIEWDRHSCEILHGPDLQGFVEEVTLLVSPFKEKQRRKPFEINLIVLTSGVLELRPMEVKRTKLEVGLFYEDDFIEVDRLIRKRLNQNKDKGIILLHGLPGTGKTTYLRYLIGKIKKKVLFLSPSLAQNLMDPELVQLLIDNPNTILVIEDAENIIMDRKFNSGSAVSNLLNISDGLLADFLNVQLICTFNSSISAIDNALLRKGRLIAKYEFGKLSVAKAQKLSKHLGFDSLITRPMTIAEIAHPYEKEPSGNRVEVIGFKRQVMEN
jgi:hypothetical protein